MYLAKGVECFLVRYEIETEAVSFNADCCDTNCFLHRMIRAIYGPSRLACQVFIGQGLAEQANIIVDGPDKRYRDLRIENTLIDEHGDDVILKNGAHVDVTFTARDPNDRH